MFKRLVSVFSILVLLFTFTPKVDATTKFKDVNLFKEEIEYLASKKIISGYPDGTFRPNEPIKRIHAVMMILREKGVTDFNAPDPGFKDIKKGSYGYEEVAKAVQMGFISGLVDSKGDKIFNPNGTLTRAQMAKILAYAYNLEGTYSKSFKDVPKNHWAYESINALAANNITVGYTDSTFKPNINISRQHFAAFMARQLDDNFKPGTKELVVHFLDVGQGDSILIQTPNGKNILVDGGIKSAGQKVVSYLAKAGITSIDLMVATHPDADHIGGLIPILENVNVKKVLDSGKTHTTQTYLEYLTLIDEKNIPFEVPIAGDFINLDKDVKIQVLNSTNTSIDNNESSIVLKMIYSQVSFLLTGDATVKNELDMIRKFDVKSTILKAGHHGANTSTSQEFVNAVKPAVTILSYGQDNRYGHPVNEVVNRLKAAGSKLYSTAESGDIVITTNGTTYNINVKPWNGGTTPQPTPDTQPDQGVTYPININTADYETLQHITGVGPVIAQRIIDYRQTRPFKKIEGIMNVKGIGQATFDKMKHQITV